MTYVVSIATYKKYNESLFPPYIPVYKTTELKSNDYLLLEYSPTDTIVEFLIKYKKNNNLTLNTLSKIIGFSPTHISNVIHGKKATQDFIHVVNKLR